MSATEAVGGAILAPGECRVVETRSHRLRPGLAVRHRTVRVGDPSDETPEMRDRLRALGDRLDRALGADPALRAPVFSSGEFSTNEAAVWLYLDSGESVPGLPPDGGTMREWGRTHLPGASALGLYPLQRIDDAGRVLAGGVSDERSRVLFTNMIDGIALRARAAVFAEQVRAAAAQVAGPMHLLSLGCGAAVPVLDALATLENGSEAMTDLVLVDLDPQALSFAAELAADAGLTDRVTIVNDNIVRACRRLPREHFHLIDMLGVWEYGSDRACEALIRSALACLAPGGSIVVSNMLSGRPQLHFNQRGVGWPAVVPRSIDRMVDIALNSGVVPEDLDVIVPEDGVYAVMVLTVRQRQDGSTL